MKKNKWVKAYLDGFVITSANEEMELQPDTVLEGSWTERLSKSKKAEAVKSRVYQPKGAKTDVGFTLKNLEEFTDEKIGNME